MISKTYRISCEKCATTEELLSHNLKESIEEAKRAKWVQRKRRWFCEECIENEKEI